MTPSPTRAWIGLGSNLGDRLRHLERAVAAIARLPGVHVAGISTWIDTEPVGGPRGQPRFLNGVLAAEVDVSARDLLTGLQAIERAHGRDRAREERHGPRTLDLDLLLFGRETIDEPGLTVPHPALEERWFVLAPLAEIAPDLELPGCRLTVVERLAELRARVSSGREISAS